MTRRCDVETFLPGPWRYEGNEIVTADGTLVALLPENSFNTRANGRIIALAPEALKALVEIDEMTAWPADGIEAPTSDPLAILLAIHRRAQSVLAQVNEAEESSLSAILLELGQALQGLLEDCERIAEERGLQPEDFENIRRARRALANLRRACSSGMGGGEK